MYAGLSVPSSFLAHQQVPKFSQHKCAHSCINTLLCPKFCTNLVLKYTKSHISPNLLVFLKLRLSYCQEIVEFGSNKSLIKIDIGVTQPVCLRLLVKGLILPLKILDNVYRLSLISQHVVLSKLKFVLPKDA